MMLKKTLPLAFAAVTTVLLGTSANAAEKDWNSTGTDFNTNGDWQTTGGAVTTFPAAGDVAAFTTVESVQPNLSVSDNISGLLFKGTGSSGFDLTRTGTTAALTLTGYNSTGSSGTSNSSAAAIRSDITTGTNTIDVPLSLAPASGTTSVFYQAAGGTLVVNGAISGVTSNLSLKGAGTIQLNGANSFATASIDQSGTTVVLGNDAALGTGTFTVGISSTIQASSARVIANTMALSGGTVTIGGTNSITFNGAVNPSGSQTRTLTVNNTGTTTFAGAVSTSDAAATTARLAINGTGNVTISGTIANGGTTTGGLSYNGIGILTLSGSNNSYTGTTSISGGSAVASANGAFGTGNVTIANGVMLTLSTGVTNAIADTATLTLGAVLGNNATLALNGATGTSQETVNGLIIDGVGMAAGTYGPTGDLAATYQSANITGTGELTVLTTTVVPEPSTWAMALLGAGLLGVSMRRLRRRNA